MIYSISGKIIAKEVSSVVLETAGIGFKIFVLSDSLSKLSVGKRAKLLCILYPEQFELFGFTKASERSLFELLNGISGIGPKIALRIMNSLDMSTLKSAIVSEDLKTFKDAGISTKTASKIILELKDKLEKEGVVYGKKQASLSETKEALRSLGYSKKQVDEALSQLPALAKTTEEKIKAALKIFARR
jgi:Holliday junction DNA helicase RuvA